MSNDDNAEAEQSPEQTLIGEIDAVADLWRWSG